MSSVSVFSILLLACIVTWMTSCKKTSSKSSADSRFSFTYNGSHYTLPFREGTGEWSVNKSSIIINRPDLFNGIIHFLSANCAYLDPNTNGLSLELAPNCQLTASGMPIDSVAVYLYESGSANITYENCRHKSEYDPFTGTSFSYDVCDAKGTFELVLKNKENKTISITNGEFEMYSFVR